MESRGEATAKDRSRFPSGMTTRKAKATDTSESMYGAPALGVLRGDHWTSSAFVAVRVMVLSPGLRVMGRSQMRAPLVPLAAEKT